VPLGHDASSVGSRDEHRFSRGSYGSQTFPKISFSTGRVSSSSGELDAQLGAKLSGRAPVFDEPLSARVRKNTNELGTILWSSSGAVRHGVGREPEVRVYDTDMVDSPGSLQAAGRPLVI
jgi:hypothetical protein